MVKIGALPEADSYSIDGWDVDNDQQQAYIQAVNKHLKNQGVIGCGIYQAWVIQTDQWAEALRKAETETGYQASWHWNMERGDTK